MTCINHPEVAVAAYCQNCGRPLCTQCMRSVGGVIYCEPCLGARLGIPIAGQVPGPTFPDRRPSPALAALLGFIPGVGAMYNGQFVKALAHVLIFAVFVNLSHNTSGIFGMFTAAWVFYQVFDAYQTAKARRDGLPLPNPFGLNDLGARLGVPQTPIPAPPPPPGPGFAGSPGPAAGQPAAAVNPGTAPAVPAYPYPYASAYVNTAPANPTAGRSSAPVGAILLIAVGLLLLFHTLGIFHEYWFSRSWPLVIVGLGAWLLYRRTRDIPRGGSQ